MNTLNVARKMISVLAMVTTTAIVVMSAAPSAFADNGDASMATSMAASPAEISAERAEMIELEAIESAKADDGSNWQAVDASADVRAAFEAPATIGKLEPLSAKTASRQ